MVFTLLPPCELSLPFLSPWAWEVSLVPVHSALRQAEGKGQRLVINCCTVAFTLQAVTRHGSLLPWVRCPSSLCLGNAFNYSSAARRASRKV